MVVWIFLLWFGMRSFLCLIKGSRVFNILVGVWLRFFIRIYFFFLIVVVRILGCYWKFFGFELVEYKLMSIFVFVCLLRWRVIMFEYIFKFLVILWINDVFLILGRLWISIGLFVWSILVRFWRFCFVVDVMIRCERLFVGLNGWGSIVLLYVMIYWFRDCVGSWVIVFVFCLWIFLCVKRICFVCVCLCSVRKL